MERFGFTKGTQLGPNYRIVEFLGEGWEGEVYKIEERRTKIIRVAKMFYDRRTQQREPHIVYAKKMHDLRRCPIVIQYHHNDRFEMGAKSYDFSVSEYADGEVLAQFIKRQRQKRLPTYEALNVLYQLAKGIEQIHDMGYYHGDIHSENIILKRKGVGFDVRLIDLIHLGKPTKSRIADDAYDLINILYEMIGKSRFYAQQPPEIKDLILGKRRDAIHRKFKDAGQIRRALESLEWGSQAMEKR